MSLSEDQEEKLVVGMYKRGVLTFGECGTELHGGRKSPIYYNSRHVLSYDASLDRQGIMSKDDQLKFRDLLIEGYAQKLLEIETEVDHVFARAQAATALASRAVQATDRMSFLWERVGEDKGYGAHSPIEGSYKYHDRVLLTDDTITGGGSMKNGIQILQSADLLPIAMTIQFDREEGGVQMFEGLGFEVNAIIGLSKAVRILRSNKRITSKETDVLQSYHEGLRANGVGSTFTMDY